MGAFLIIYWGLCITAPDLGKPAKGVYVPMAGVRFHTKRLNGAMTTTSVARFEALLGFGSGSIGALALAVKMCYSPSSPSSQCQKKAASEGGLPPFRRPLDRGLIEFTLPCIMKEHTLLPHTFYGPVFGDPHTGWGATHDECLRWCGRPVRD